MWLSMALTFAKYIVELIFLDCQQHHKRSFFLRKLTASEHWNAHAFKKSTYAHHTAYIVYDYITRTNKLYETNCIQTV